MEEQDDNEEEVQLIERMEREKETERVEQNAEEMIQTLIRLKIIKIITF